MRFLFLFACLCVGLSLRAAVAEQLAPDWLRKAEVFNGWYKQWDSSAMERMRGIPAVIGCPPDRAVIDKAHAMGVRVLPYATFYQMPRKEVYQRAVLDEHPDWIVIAADGSEVRSCFDGTENTGWMALCPNSVSYRSFALAHVNYLMELGADGLFIDNAHPEAVCEGPKYGRHQHVYAGRDNIHAYRELLLAIRAIVRRSGSDRVVIVNPGVPRREWIGACDGQMLESFICTWAAPRRWHNEQQLAEWMQDWSPVAEAGQAIAALSYIGHTDKSPREDAFYCYAWARLCSFIWADWFTADRQASCLFRLRLGNPLEPAQMGEFHTRRFERGTIVVTGDNAATVRLDAGGNSRVFDLFAARHLKPVDGGFVVDVPPGQGRVYLFD